MADAPKQNRNITSEISDVSCPENTNYFSNDNLSSSNISLVFTSSKTLNSIFGSNQFD